MKPQPWRKCPLIEGRKYKVTVELRSILEEIQAGDLVVYREAAYSPYDGMTIYMFNVVRTGDVARWALLDSESDPIWEEVFEPV